MEKKEKKVVVGDFSSIFLWKLLTGYFLTNPSVAAVIPATTARPDYHTFTHPPTQGNILYLL